MKRWKKKVLESITESADFSLKMAKETYDDDVVGINTARDIAITILDNLQQKVDTITAYHVVKITTDKQEVYHELAQILNTTFERRIGFGNDLQLFAKVGDMTVCIVGFDNIPGCKITYETKTTKVAKIECED